MTRRRLLWMAMTTVFALGAAAKVCTAKMPSPKKAGKQLTELEQRWLANLSNPKVLDKILASDFVHVLPSGFITKKGHIDYVREHPFPQNVSRHFEVIRVRIYGSVGIVNGIVDARSRNGTVRRTAFTDVFAYRKGKWQAVNAQELLLAEGAARR